MVVRATLVKLSTDDGLVQFEAHAKLGAEYFVDVTTIMRAQRLIHTGDNGTPTVHHKDIIWTVDGIWLPLQCLSLHT